MLSVGRRRVVDAVPAPVLEAGTPPVGASRVAVVAHWSQQPEVSRSLRRLVEELVRGGYGVVVVSTAACEGPLDWPDRPAAACVYRRANVGYDFGSWAQALHLHPAIADAEVVVLANDSMLGPFGSLQPILQGIERTEAPVWGLVSTSQDAPHLQSHFVAYRNGILRHPALAAFWRDIRVQPSKRRLIVAYEIGLARVLRRNRISYDAGFPYERVVAKGGNPTSAGWRRLLLWGFPFVKRELVLRRPAEVPDVGDVPAVVWQMFGEDVLQWV